MSTIKSQQPQTTTQPAQIGRLHRGRTLILAVAMLIALLSATVAIGQSSADFDLACRGLMVAGGNVSTGDNFAVIGAMGIPIAPGKDSEVTPTYAVRSADFAIRGGFLPGYPTGQTNGQNAVAANEGTAPTLSQQINVQRLPLISKIGAIIRGGC